MLCFFNPHFIHSFEVYEINSSVKIFKKKLNCVSMSLLLWFKITLLGVKKNILNKSLLLLASLKRKPL